MNPILLMSYLPNLKYTWETVSHFLSLIVCDYLGLVFGYGEAESPFSVSSTIINQMAYITNGMHSCIILLSFYNQIPEWCTNHTFFYTNIGHANVGTYFHQLHAGYNLVSLFTIRFYVVFLFLTFQLLIQS